MEAPKKKKAVVKPYNMDIALRYNSHIIAILVHHFIAVDKELNQNPSMAAKMLRSNAIGTDEESNLLVNMSKERYEHYFKPRKASHYERELKILLEDRMIIHSKVIEGEKNAKYYRLNYDHYAIQRYYGNLSKLNIVLNSRMLMPRQGMAIHFNSWDVALFIEILHRYPLLHKAYNDEYNRRVFNQNFSENGSHLAVNTGSSLFKKMTPPRMDYQKIISKLCDGILIKMPENRVSLNYEHQTLKKFMYFSPIVAW